jgi:hypothetical protein
VGYESPEAEEPDWLIILNEHGHEIPMVTRSGEMFDLEARAITWVSNTRTPVLTLIEIHQTRQWRQRHRSARPGSLERELGFRHDRRLLNLSRRTLSGVRGCDPGFRQ